MFSYYKKDIRGKQKFEFLCMLFNYLKVQTIKITKYILEPTGTTNINTSMYTAEKSFESIKKFGDRRMAQRERSESIC